MTLTVSLTIPAERIADLMTTFFESGDPVSRSWCIGVKAGPHSLKAWRKVKTEDDSHWYADPKFWSQPEWRFAICEENGDSDVSASGKWHEIGPSEFVKGLTLLATSKDGAYAKHFADILTDNTDAATADILMQMVCLGEETYA
jgi:hypothetical protein